MNHHRLLAAALAASVGIHALAAWTLSEMRLLPRSTGDPAARALALRLQPAPVAPPAPAPRQPPAPVPRPVAAVRNPAPTHAPAAAPAPRPPRPAARATRDQPPPADTSPSPEPPPAPVVAGGRAASPPAAVAPAAPDPDPDRSADTALRAQLRQRYLEQLLARIEAEKHYPAAARRRRIAGTVEVSFVLQRTGEVRDLAFTGAHPLLRAAAARALQRALPLPAPPPALNAPRRLHFSMVFRQR